VLDYNSSSKEEGEGEGEGVNKEHHQQQFLETEEEIATHSP
jgi:hypothetical protein